MTNKNSEKRRAGRFDFQLEEIESLGKDENGNEIVRYKMIFDPRKYEWIETKGKRYLKDKFTRTIIPEEELQKMKLRHGAPVFYSPPIENNYCVYLSKRKNELVDFWNEKYIIREKIDSIDELLTNLSGKETQVVIFYVDMEGSTRISAEVNNATNLKIIKIFTMQMAMAIHNFRGYVLKYVGDCVIGIFPADENFTNMCDNAIQAAMIMKNLIEDVINPLFTDKGLPIIGCHIGIDIGIVSADRVGAINISTINDLIGHHMNLTAKIQAQAGHNEILIGDNFFRLIHCTWQEKCEKIDLGPDWKMKNPYHDKIYEIYRFNGTYSCKHIDELKAGNNQ